MTWWWHFLELRSYQFNIFGHGIEDHRECFNENVTLVMPRTHCSEMLKIRHLFQPSNNTADSQVCISLHCSYFDIEYTKPVASALRLHIVSIKFSLLRINLCPYASKYWRFKSFILHFISPFTITQWLRTSFFSLLISILSSFCWNAEDLICKAFSDWSKFRLLLSFCYLKL